MPESVLAFGIVPFEKLDGSVFGHGAGDIPFLTVDFGGEYVSGKTRADALGHFVWSDT